MPEKKPNKSRKLTVNDLKRIKGGAAALEMGSSEMGSQENGTQKYPGSKSEGGKSTKGTSSY